ncbi:MAG: hypothetical protein HKP12_14770 [Gammaproteobacteria bacterium]|nr:hypothetical protein [Gammaproteobacteria bacterium]
MSSTDQVFEGVFKILGEIAPVACIQVQALQDCRYFRRNRAFLVFTQNAAAPVDQLKLLGEAKR